MQSILLDDVHLYQIVDPITNNSLTKSNLHAFLCYIHAHYKEIKIKLQGFALVGTLTT